MAANRDRINRNLKQFWISQGGKEDIAYQNNQVMLARLKQLSIKYSYSESPGGHTWPVWRHDLYQFECGMAKVGYERWLWWSPEVHNPYMGQKMLKCGKRLDVLEP